MRKSSNLSYKNQSQSKTFNYKKIATGHKSPSSNLRDDSNSILLKELDLRGLTKINSGKDMREPYVQYERAVFNYLYYIFRPPKYRVFYDYKVRGDQTDSYRQLDIAVIDVEDKTHPYLLVECRRRSRKLDVIDSDAIVGKLADVKGHQALLVSSKGFSTGVIKSAEVRKILPKKLTLEDAARLNWREVIRQIFPFDEVFHTQMGDMLYEFVTSGDFWNVIEHLENIPFEEWGATLLESKRLNRERYIDLLQFIAEYHHDDGWRFNAKRLLDDEIY